MNFVLDIVTSFVGSDLPGTELSNNESIQKYLEDKSCNYLSIVINNQDNKKKVNLGKMYLFVP